MGFNLLRTRAGITVARTLDGKVRDERHQCGLYNINGLNFISTARILDSQKHISAQVNARTQK